MTDALRSALEGRPLPLAFSRAYGAPLIGVTWTAGLPNGWGWFPINSKHADELRMLGVVEM